MSSNSERSHRWFGVGDLVLWSPTLRPVGYGTDPLQAVVLGVWDHALLVRVTSTLRAGEPDEWTVWEEELRLAPRGKRRLSRRAERLREPQTAEQRAKLLARYDRKGR
jgi:hypothetical protein